MILVDRACVEAELYNLHFCSVIRLGQRTNELSPTTVSLVFIFFRKLLDRRSVLAKGQRWREGFAWWLFIYLFSWRCRDQLCACADVSVCVCVSLSPVKGDPRGVRGGEAPSYMCYPGDAALGVTRMVGR